MAANSQFVMRLLKEDRERTLVNFQQMQNTLAQARLDGQRGDKRAAQLAEFSTPTSLPNDAPPSMSVETFALQKWRTHCNKVESGLYALSQRPAQPATTANPPRTTVAKQSSHLKVVGVLDSIPIPLIPMAHMVPTVTASPVASKAVSGKRPSPSPSPDVDSVFGSDSEPVITKAPRRSKTSVTAPGAIRKESTKTAPAVQPTASHSNKFASIPVKKRKTVEAEPARMELVEPRRGSRAGRQNARNDEEERAVELLRQFRGRLTKILKDHSRLDTYVNDLREDLHKLVFAKITSDDVEGERLLSDETGLPTIFDPEHSQGMVWPWDVAADAKEVYNNWISHKFHVDLLEGIDAPIKVAKAGNLARKTINRATHWRIKEGYQVDHDKHGHNGLVAGQWWPRQICAVRDGAHGSLMAGISGTPEDGAWSVVMSGKQYEKQDEDHGDWVWYSGTILAKDSLIDGEEVSTTRFTQIMFKSVGSGKPVRLMRSSNLGKNNTWKPSEGFRYDGLYLVTEKRSVDTTKGHWQFKLVRQSNQPPIRRSGALEGRPNPEEVDEWARIQRLKGINLSE